MKRLATIGTRLKAPSFVAACAGLAPAAAGQEALHATRTVESVRVEVTWVASQAELEAKREQRRAAKEAKRAAEQRAREAKARAQQSRRDAVHKAKRKHH